MSGREEKYGMRAGKRAGFWQRNNRGVGCVPVFGCYGESCGRGDNHGTGGGTGKVYFLI